MDEWVDIWSSDARPTGEKALKSEAHRLGLFHPTVHIWIYNTRKEILLQQRSPQKNTFPGKWDVSVAGHITAGDAPIETAVRECREELGILIDPGDLELISIKRSEIHHSPVLIDREFHHIYGLHRSLEPEHLLLQEEEVSAAKWFDIDQFKNMQENPLLYPEIISFDEEYLHVVFDFFKTRF